MFMISLLIHNYLGILTSFMSLEPFKWQPINSLKEFEESDLKWLVRETNPIIKYFQNSQIMNDKMVTYNITSTFDSVVFAMQKINDNPNMFAYINANVALKLVASLRFADIDGNHEFHAGEKPVRETNSFYYLQKHAVYNEDLALNMLKLTQHGILHYLELKSYDPFFINGRYLARKENRLPKKNRKEGIHMEQMTGSFILTVIGYVLSLVALVIEALWYKFNRTVIQTLPVRHPKLYHRVKLIKLIIPQIRHPKFSHRFKLLNLLKCPWQFKVPEFLKCSCNFQLLKFVQCTAIFRWSHLRSTYLQIMQYIRRRPCKNICNRKQQEHRG